MLFDFYDHIIIKNDAMSDVLKAKKKVVKMEIEIDIFMLFFIGFYFLLENGAKSNIRFDYCDLMVRFMCCFIHF
jgi:hypothetical protein